MGKVFCQQTQHFRSMRHWVFAILALNEAVGQGIPWYRAAYGTRGLNFVKMWNEGFEPMR